MPKINYIPINYDSWDFSGRGKNIVDFLNSVEKNIWERALPFQDKRNDTGHAEFVTHFALKLLNFHPNTEREIIVPTAILHDIGWSQMSETELKLFYDKNMERYEPILRARHQEQGIIKAREILERSNYDPNDVSDILEIYNSKDITNILEIISEHDTRKDFLNKNDGVVRDADKLWRYTLPHLELGLRERNLNPDEFAQFLTSNINKEGFFYSPVSKEIAEIELKNALAHWKKK